MGTATGAAHVKNANGSIEIAQCGDGSKVRTATGPVTIGRSLGSVNVRSASAAVSIAEVCAGAVTVRAGAGSVTIGVREGVAAWLQLVCGMGSVHNNLQAIDGPKNPKSTVEVRVRAGGGDITINRAGAAVTV